MRKAILIIGLLILAIIIGFFVGIYLYNTEAREEQMENEIQNIQGNNLTNTQLLNRIEIETIAIEEKVSVDTEVI